MITEAQSQTVISEVGNKGHCRFCGAPLRTSVVDLGMAPLSNSIRSANQIYSVEHFYPLHVFVCDSCYLTQLVDFIGPEEIFNSEYSYFSSFSTSWLDHAKRYADMMVKRFGLNEQSQVIEIASNDGYLLQYFQPHKVPVLGIEPTSNTAAAAQEKGIPTLVEFFGVRLAEQLKQQGKSADLILGNNVLAHVPDINDFVGGLKILLKPRGVITIEFPHLMRLIDGNQFDTIYHEHYSYLSFMAVQKIFAEHGLTLFDVEELSTHGGSLRIFGRHAEDSTKPISGAVTELLTRELDAGYSNPAMYTAFGARVAETKRRLLNCLINLKQNKKTIVGYGAPAKGNTLLNYCGIRTDMLDYVVDRSPHKQGHFTPGTHIPIFAPEMIAETRPDYVLILPWNLKTEIMQQMAHIAEWGGRFIVPIPAPQILNPPT